MRAGLIACALLAAAVAAGPARAQDAVLGAASAAERAALASADENKYVRARDQAEAVLAANRDSFLATWVLALVQHYEEGNHARALFLVRRAGKLLATRHDNDARWHRKVLLEEFDVLHEMDRLTESLAVLDRHDALYTPAQRGLRIWPLMKLQRFAEARAIAQELIPSDNIHDRIRGYNSMLAIAAEEQDRGEAYRWGQTGVEATGGRSCILLSNTALAALARARFDEAESLWLRAGEAETDDCAHPTYGYLAELYFLEGELQKTIAALEKLRGQAVRKEHRAHFGTWRTAVLANLLYALGKPGEAQARAAEVFASPPRSGLTSLPPAIVHLMNGVPYWMILDARAIELAERASYRPLWAARPVDRAGLALVRWEVRRSLLRLAAGEDVLVKVVRPYLNELPPWQAVNLIPMLGTGVMAAAVARARALDRDYPETVPYYDALDGEIAFRHGDLTSAIRLGEAALEGLPRAEALVRARVAAWSADALRRRGRLADATTHYAEVLQRFPTALRVLDLALPVAYTGDGSRAAAAAIDRLRDSRRFTEVADSGFRVDAQARGRALELCLLNAGGFRYACATGDGDDPVTAAVDELHRVAFAPKVELTQADLHSLDGSPARVSADDVLDEVLGP